MSNEPQEPSEIRFFDAIREAYVEGWTGRLGLDSADIRGQLFCVGGDLYISPEHPFAAAATGWSNSLRAIQRRAAENSESEQEAAEAQEPARAGQQSAEARLATRRVIAELTDLLSPCARESCHFVDGAGQIRLDLIGPLPTARPVSYTHLTLPTS